jgi:hypothetical protein
MCCGQKRSLLNNTEAASWPRSKPPQPAVKGWKPSLPGRAAMPSSISPSSGNVAVRYLKTGPVRVRGLITGCSYEFAGPQSVADIDQRDVPGLLNTGLFRPA